MFSIVIPLYNKFNFIKETVYSVLNQTYNEFEIIIVNDGSTDKSLEAAKEIKDSRIKIYSKINEGVSIARNFGISKASNEYIAFLDADDLWRSDYLETLKGLIKKYPEASLFSTAYYINNDRNKAIFFSDEIEDILIDNYCKGILTKKIFCWTSSTCIRKKVINEVGNFKEGIQIGEDIDLWLRVGLKYKVAFSYKECAIYKTNTENNLMSLAPKPHVVFPYWNWYAYQTNDCHSLYRLTFDVLYVLCTLYYRCEKYKSAKDVFNRIKIDYLTWKQRIKYINMKLLLSIVR